MNKNLNDIQNLQYFGGNRKKNIHKKYGKVKNQFHLLRLASFSFFLYSKGIAFAYIPVDTRRRFKVYEMTIRRRRHRVMSYRR